MHWNCFDSLLGRRCKTKTGLFNLIESRTAVTDFAKEREIAEYSCSSLSEVYSKLAETRSWSTQEIEVFKRIEIATEIEQSFPIYSNIEKIAEGDVIHNNSLLPHAAIVQLLQNHGAIKNIRISGELCADVCNDAITTTEIEEILPEEFSLFVRVLRLSNPYTEGSKEYECWLSQAQYNIPVLALASCLLPENNISFIVPECSMLRRIHQEIYGAVNPTVKYLAEYQDEQPSGYLGYLRRAKRNGLLVGLSRHRYGLERLSKTKLDVALDFRYVDKLENQKLLSSNMDEHDPVALLVLNKAIENLKYFKPTKNIEKIEDALAKFLAMQK